MKAHKTQVALWPAIIILLVASCAPQAVTPISWPRGLPCSVRDDARPLLSGG